MPHAIENVDELHIDASKDDCTKDRYSEKRMGVPGLWWNAPSHKIDFRLLCISASEASVRAMHAQRNSQEKPAEGHADSCREWMISRTYIPLNNVNNAK